MFKKIDKNRLVKFFWNFISGYSIYMYLRNNNVLTVYIYCWPLDTNRIKLSTKPGVFFDSKPQSYSIFVYFKLANSYCLWIKMDVHVCWCWLGFHPSYIFKCIHFIVNFVDYILNNGTTILSLFSKWLRHASLTKVHIRKTRASCVKLP